MSNQPEQFEFDPGHCAFFFDVDGTLAEIQPRPDLVFIPERTLAALKILHARGFPVAVVSGRRLAELDQLLAPLQLPAAGVHGAERRGADGQLRQLALDQHALKQIQDELIGACAALPGLHLENKGFAFALHYRLAPELERDAQTLAEDFARRYAQVLSLQPGKCVFELKPKGASKGEVIRTFMAEVPFCGRLPVFIGDDLTDESGFAAVNALGGHTFKVGPGPTEARQRLASVAAVGEWLDNLLQSITEPSSSNNK